jgi:hypothetical protein
MPITIATDKVIKIVHETPASIDAKMTTLSVSAKAAVTFTGFERPLFSKPITKETKHGNAVTGCL